MTARTRLQLLFPAALALALSACGGSPSMRFYRGTMTVTNVTGTSTYINTTSGELVHAVPSATEPSRWIISIDALDFNGLVAGDSLTIPSQTFTLVETGGFASMTNAMASGSGTMSAQQVGFSISVTGTSKYGSSTEAINQTMVFNGNRE